MSVTAKDITLVETCGACPEQYEAFIADKQVGYLRLRHGHFRVDFPDCGGETIYSAYPAGDGSFTDKERPYFLKKARQAILTRLKR